MSRNSHVSVFTCKYIVSQSNLRGDPGTRRFRAIKRVTASTGHGLQGNKCDSLNCTYSQHSNYRRHNVDKWYFDVVTTFNRPTSLRWRQSSREQTFHITAPCVGNPPAIGAFAPERANNWSYDVFVMIAWTYCTNSRVAGDCRRHNPHVTLLQYRVWLHNEGSERNPFFFL